jgi:hypothetical protein
LPYFSDGVLGFYLELVSDCNSISTSCIVGIAAMRHCAQLVSEIRSCKLFTQAGLGLQSS